MFMTVAKGLLEAIVLLVIGVSVAAFSGFAWIIMGSGSFLGRWGTCLVVLGVLLSFGGNTAMSRLGTNDAFAWLGMGPERAESGADGGRVLTAAGIFPFVAVPMVLAGGFLTF